jgi:hypothetical protein
VPGGCGVEDDEVVVVQARVHELRDPLEHRRLVGAGRVPGELHVLVDLGGEVLGHQPADGGAHGGEVGVGRGDRVHLDAVEGAAAEVAGQRGDPVTHRALPQVPEVVGGVGRDDEHPAAGAGLGEGGGGGDGGLADAALAAHEQDPAGGGEL